MSFDLLDLVGQTEIDLVAIDGQYLRAEVIPALLQLQLEAAEAGFQLSVASGYRSFTRQQRIWDEKAQGARQLLDDNGEPLCFESLSPEQRLFAILRWSALPGASRHHWGTDFDVFDRCALSDGQKVQLTHAETDGDGPFAPLHRWLDRRLEEPECPFFRPYVAPAGGVASEPWHLSYAPLSSQFQSQLNYELILSTIQQSNIELKNEVIARLPEIFELFICVPWSLYPEKCRIEK